MIKINCKEELLDRTRSFVKHNKLQKPTVAILTGVDAEEYKALTLFSENMRLASEALNAIPQLPQNAAYYMYASAILMYRQMFKSCSGVNRDRNKINLIGGAIRNKDGTVKINNKGAKQNITADRFYIEEFVEHKEAGFNTYFKMIDQADKYLCHLDKESNKNAFAVMVFEDNKPFHILNHYEYSMFNINDIQTMYDHCISLQSLTDNKLKIVTKELWTAAATSSIEDHKDNLIFSSSDF